MGTPPQTDRSPVAEASLSPGPQPAERVLLVGASSEVVRRITRVLKEWKCEVISAETWNSVENTSKRQSCQLIVFDLSRPGSGENSAAVRRIMEAGGSPAVLVISQGPAERDPLIRRVRPAFHLTLPLSDKTLAPVLSAALEHSRMLAENAELKSRMRFDDLTQAYNRKYLQRHLEEELERSIRYRHSFSILFADLDHLKSINDHHGHLYGNQILRQLAEFFMNHLRRSDKVFRFGGDEFVLTLPETDKRQAQQVAKRLSKTLPLQSMGKEDQATRGLTVSIGIATFPADGRTGTELLQKADQDMYKAKNSR